jgi:hypothetical protein
MAIETYFIIAVNDDGTFTSYTTEPEEKLEPKRLATTWDIFQTCQSISKEFETQVLVDRIVNQVVSAMTPAAAPSIPDKLKEALKERGINPESVATAD